MIDCGRLIELLASESKHGGYHVLPQRLKDRLGINYRPKKMHHEEARLRFILKYLDPKGKSVLDIGANTGFFSFGMLDAEACRVTAYEGNPLHAEFITAVAAEMAKPGLMQTVSRYFDFQRDSKRRHDITLLLNVLHHTGDDYGNSLTSIGAVKVEMLRQANSIAALSEHMVLQIGFNWKGDPTLPLFDGGTKREMIHFIQKGIADHWNIVNIGIACRDVTGRIQFNPLDEINIERDDRLGEFLNRPIFIMSSKHEPGQK
jgi:hypothetical protein